MEHTKITLLPRGWTLIAVLAVVLLTIVVLLLKKGLVDLGDLITLGLGTVGLIFLVQQAKDRRDQRVVAAWTLLDSVRQRQRELDKENNGTEEQEFLGNIGQIDALETLHHADIDFSRINLEGMDLTKLNLGKRRLWFPRNIFHFQFLERWKLLQYSTRKPIFEFANLKRTMLLSVNLQGVNFGCVNLRNTNLINANLQSSELIMANLRNTKFLNTNLLDVILVNAKLQDTDFANTHISNCKFSDADTLTHTKGLEEAWIWEGQMPKFMNGDKWPDSIARPKEYPSAWKEAYEQNQSYGNGPPYRKGPPYRNNGPPKPWLWESEDVPDNAIEVLEKLSIEDLEENRETIKWKLNKKRQRGKT